MHLNEKQREEIKNIIEKAKQTEYSKFNATIVNAVKELNEGKKTQEEAYNKIYKKVVKNEHHLVHRYANLDDEKSLKTLAEVVTDEIIEKNDFDNLDEFVKKEIARITGLKN